MYWSGDFAYIVGLITTDGCLSKDGRHITFTSKDFEQIENFKKILGLKNKPGLKNSGSNPEKKYYYFEFGDVRLYKYLVSIGLYSKKSKVLNGLKIPKKYFPDFLRGCFDGDGYSYAYWSRQWKNSFVLYTGFTSGSLKFLEWMQSRIASLYEIKGYIKKSGRSAYLLMYAKRSSLMLIKIMYHSEGIPFLARKKIKIDKALKIIDLQAGVAKLADAHD